MFDGPRPAVDDRSGPEGCGGREDGTSRARAADPEAQRARIRSMFVSLVLPELLRRKDCGHFDPVGVPAERRTAQAPVPDRAAAPRSSMAQARR